MLRKSASVWPNSNHTLTPSELSNAKKLKLLFVDDDDNYREAAVGELEYLGFEVIPLSDGPSVLEFFAQGNTVDMVVLDWNLASGPSIDLLPQLRRHGVQVPVVFLTGVPATAYESTALDHGALDFVDKTRGLAILAKRIRLIIENGKRPPQALGKEVVRCGKLVLRPAVSRAYWNDKDIDLTVTEFNIVHLLVSRAAEYVTYRAIYDCVHSAGFIAGSGDDGYRTNVRSSIKRIRNKFRTIDAEFAEIENFPAFGYRWRSAPPSAE